MKKIKWNQIACLYLCFLLLACAEDKGNYDYKEKNVIKIEDISSEYAVLSGSDYIDVKPTVTSNVDGVIEDGNANFEFLYERKTDDGWVVLDTTVVNKKNLYSLARLASGTYDCRFTVTDKRTGVKTMQLFYVKSTTYTTEGWMLLCNEGEDKRVRLDMLAQIDFDRIIPTYDVLRMDETVEPMYHATNLKFYNNHTSNNNKIFMLSETAGYLIPNADPQRMSQEFTTLTAADAIKNNLFAYDAGDHIVNVVTVPKRGMVDHDALICVSGEGNAYCWNAAQFGSVFEDPINTSKRGGTPEYKVSPFIGVSLVKDYYYAPEYGVALLYDTDNHRFIGWDSKDVATDDAQGKKQTCYPLTDPATKLFSFSTGNMDVVAMCNSAFSFSGICYCIMQDGNQRHIYGIDLSTNEFKQIYCHLNVSAPGFSEADCFVASNQAAMIYYAHQNKVYTFNVATGQYREVLTLAAGEKVTCQKFNLYDEPFGWNAVDYGIFKNKEAEAQKIYQEREHDLIVASYNTQATDSNGGILRFYDVDIATGYHTLKEGMEYSGFAEIVDICYKEV